ncbi:hypothetical protein niasHS_016935 [Heterodera schachtii]|uniref:Uncharacterized protein n=2 Tax=Heterodera TaxID=34509 RepID=A0ABD2I001_HETSC
MARPKANNLKCQNAMTNEAYKMPTPLATHLLPNLRNAIGKLTTAINGELKLQNRNLRQCKIFFYNIHFLLAYWRQISRDELVPRKKRMNANEQLQYALKELAKI